MARPVIRTVIALALLAAAGTVFAATPELKAVKPEKNRKKIVVVSLGPAVIPVTAAPAGLPGRVEYMKRHWTAELVPVLPDRPDLIVLPELCDRYSGMTPEEIEEYHRFRGDQLLDFFADLARRHRCYIAYPSARLAADGSWRNSTRLIDREGNVAGIYDKNYPTIGDMTRNRTVAGRHAPVVETDFGRVAFAICFDLNYHEFLERTAVQRPDIILFSSYYHGGLMQEYWAYHCRSYFVGSIAGTENAVLNPAGSAVARSTDYFHRVTATVNLDYQVVHLGYNEEKLRQLKDCYGSGVTVFDPGHLGAVLLTSERDDVTSEEMIRRFGIETWDEYYRRSVENRNRKVEK